MVRLLFGQEHDFRVIIVMLLTMTVLPLKLVAIAMIEGVDMTWIRSNVSQSGVKH